MNSDDLRIFVAVAEAQGVSRAAARLRLPKSSVSRQVARLEAEAGAVLFERGRGGVRLTEAGRVLLDQAVRVGQLIEDAAASVQAALFRGSEKLDKFRADMNWKQEELEKWAILGEPDRDRPAEGRGSQQAAQAQPLPQPGRGSRLRLRTPRPPFRASGRGAHRRQEARREWAAGVMA